ncbi:MAG: enoyl-CoA hydratase/isomerase family protein [Xanthomonadales bacterium]|nr:enoyl-CoA hydratase/isomerase family protein [Xanthomonadales bacterium]
MLEIQDHGRIREIRLNRPPVNALNPELIDALNGALKTAAAEAGAVVLSGREGMFSAGLDVPTLLGLDRAAMSDFWGSFSGLLETVGRMPIPVAAAITGHSPAGGAVISLFCDTRIMSEGRFKIGLNETQVGLSLPPFIHQALVRLVGAHKAEGLLVSGALVGPQEALALGLVDQLAEDPASTVAQAVAWCENLLRLPPVTMSNNRRMMRESLTRLFDEAGTMDHEAFLSVWFSEETQATLHALVAALGKK